MAEEGREADVYVRLGGTDVLAGRLWSRRRGNAESQTFAYDHAYPKVAGAYELDPALGFLTGQHQTPRGREIFGAFSDSSPDRWGRRLIARAERKRAKREGGARRSFGETDLLLGVRDDLRQGALRFREPGAADFSAPEDRAVPAFLNLPELLGASERIERDEDDEETLETLLRGGSSLGGARPKAHILGPGGQVSIAKFPAPSVDEWDVMRWEAVALRLAHDAGIRVPPSALHTVDGRSVLVVERFDRVEGERIGYVSAMTMLERVDGESGSYLEIADVITRNSPQATEDLRELWRRMAFSVLISNLDDHLRNHAFLRTSTAGWTLSPAFDLNPDPGPGERLLKTAIDFDENEAAVEPLLGVAEWFRLDTEEAIGVLGEVNAATARWREVGTSHGADRSELELIEPAFEHAASRAAREMLD